MPRYPLNVVIPCEPPDVEIGIGTGEALFNPFFGMLAPKHFAQDFLEIVANHVTCGAMNGARVVQVTRSFDQVEDFDKLELLSRALVGIAKCSPCVSVSFSQVKIAAEVGGLRVAANGQSSPDEGRDADEQEARVDPIPTGQTIEERLPPR